MEQFQHINIQQNRKAWVKKPVYSAAATSNSQPTSKPVNKSYTTANSKPINRPKTNSSARPPNSRQSNESSKPISPAKGGSKPTKTAAQTKSSKEAVDNSEDEAADGKPE